MAQEYIILIVCGLGIGGSLGGVILGQQMSRSWQREQWRLDRRLEEFRELLDAIADGRRVTLTWRVGAILGEGMQREVLATSSHTMQVIRNRVFILHEVIQFRIEERWTAAVSEYIRTYNTDKLGSVFNEIREQIVNASQKTRLSAPKPWYTRILRSRR